MSSEVPSIFNRLIHRIVDGKGGLSRDARKILRIRSRSGLVRSGIDATADDELIDTAAQIKKIIEDQKKGIIKCLK